MVVVMEGDGSWGKRMADGMCPKCHTSSITKLDNAVKCKTCGLTVIGTESDSADDNQRYAPYDNL